MLRVVCQSQPKSKSRYALLPGPLRRGAQLGAIDQIGLKPALVTCLHGNFNMSKLCTAVTIAADIRTDLSKIECLVAYLSVDISRIVDPR